MNTTKNSSKVCALLALVSVLGIAANMVAAAQKGAPVVERGWYGGASLGLSQMNVNEGNINAGLFAAGFTSAILGANDDRGLGFKVFGGYQFGRHLAVEGGYFDLGRFGYTSTTVPAGTLSGSVKPRGFNLDAVGMLPISARVAALGRFGIHNTDSNETFSGSGGVTVINPSPGNRESGYKLGIGVQFSLTESVRLRGEVERYRINNASSTREVDLFSAGIQYRF